MLTLAFMGMVTSLMAQGLYFWARDSVTRDLSGGFFVSDVVWAVTLCSIVCYRRYPWITITCSWGLLLTVAIVYWRYYAYYRFTALLIISLPSVASVFFAQLGLHLRRKRLARVDALN